MIKIKILKVYNDNIYNVHVYIYSLNLDLALISVKEDRKYMYLTSYINRYHFQICRFGVNYYNYSIL